MSGPKRKWIPVHGWIVEGWMMNSGVPRFRTIHQGMITWTTDLNEALWFARREDAESFAAADMEVWRVVEHTLENADEGKS